jgi:uncharacterized OsmC-like protein
MPTVKAAYKGDTLFDVTTGNHTCLIDLPATVGGKDRAPTPTDLFVCSLTACIGALVYMYCRDMKIDSEGLTVEMSYEKLEKPARLGKFKATIHLPKGGWEQRKEGILRAANRCPVHETILRHEGLEVTVV